MIQAIGFDLDDTLYDHAQYVKGAYLDVALEVERQIGVPRDEFFTRIYTDWQELTSQCNHIFSDALAAYDAYSPEIERCLVKVYRAHDPMLVPYPGVVDGLRALREVGFKLGLLTDGQVEVQRRKLKVLGLENFFDVKVYTGNLGRAFYKPHQAGFLALISDLGLEPGEVAYVGDNPLVDFESAKRIGMCTFRVLTGEYKKLHLSDKWVDQTFENAFQAMNWFLGRRETAQHGKT